MSIMKIAKIKDSNSKEYRKLVSGIYSQFENLYKTMAFTRLPKAFPISGRLTNTSKKPSTGNCAAVNGENA